MNEGLNKKQLDLKEDQTELDLRSDEEKIEDLEARRKDARKKGLEYYNNVFIPSLSTEDSMLLSQMIKEEIKDNKSDSGGR